ncbi:BufA1 family periplasmic bufferin-type metallophore [Thalassotalea euphylliae]|uniref:DUF2282 domain-containing protein n=1 Tax=Thalassotalea euphylliae TaxID=1655234 RepID=A0A3E0TZQ7_9GAMM|nr:DUF2282 domain-containing protein [Thalassotalea euphylliae]REL29944.1 DUF2282 domain-containing protein [Thalassotalea euphylliae]REL35145.1 DUF2282 domain-containing protein [Thalassotalea euphylliae]
MKNQLALSAALAAVVSMGVINSAEAADNERKRAPKERCYGISPAGQNDCGNLAGTHSCAGQSTIDNDPGEWRLVNKGSCESLGGMLRKEAKAKFKAMQNS